MSETKPHSPSQKIAKLRRTFLEQLPDRLAQARALQTRLTAAAGDHNCAVDLHRVLHNLKGTGASFGFREFGAVTAVGERLLAALLENPAQPPQQWQERLDGFFAELEQAARAVACSPDGGDGCCDVLGFNLPASPREHAPGGGRLLYICDDDALVLEKLARQLACFGYETKTFLDPKSLFAATQAQRPDALILDIHFPEGNNAGIELLLALRREIKGEPIPAVFLSGRDDFAARMAAVQAGGEAYFLKPARISEMVVSLDLLTQRESLAPYRVLIVDDEPEVAKYHSILLQEAGMVTCILDKPACVLEVLQEFLPDMVLMDIYMPETSGLDLAKLIRQVPSLVGLPIVYLSSEPDRAKQFSAMRIGADGFMTKPVAPDELVATVAIRADRMRILRSLMARDSLTGLFNHTTTTHLLERAIAAAGRNNTPMCFAMIDLDHFKQVNDSHGHLVGDQVLLALSRMLRQRLRSADIVGRYGGEEFAVILPDTSGEETARLIDELRQSFSQIVFQSATDSFNCAFSAGVASYPAHRSMEALREAADRALYEAKRGGRNRVVCDVLEK